jgi:hypothetical protein
MRAANRFLRATGRTEFDTLYTEHSAHGNDLEDGRGWPRRSLPGCAAVQTLLAERARCGMTAPWVLSERPALFDRRKAHAHFLAYARDDLAAWRHLGGFLP